MTSLGLFLQFLGQPLVSRQFLVAAAAGSRGLRGLAGQFLQPGNLGLERVAFRFFARMSRMKQDMAVVLIILILL